MISYVTLGTNDLDRAAKYYDELLAELGAKRMMENERIILWGTGGAPMLAVCKPFDEQCRFGWQWCDGRPRREQRGTGGGNPCEGAGAGWYGRRSARTAW